MDRGSPERRLWYHFQMEMTVQLIPENIRCARMILK